MSRSEKWKAVFKRLWPYGLTVLITATVTVCVMLLIMWRNTSKLDRLETVIDRYFIEKYDQEAVEDAAAAAMVGALGNPWSFYVPASEYEAYMGNMSNSYLGIGVTISQREDGIGLDILEVDPAGGAYEAGIRAGDILVSVAGEKISGDGLERASSLIRGESGTYVSVGVLRGQEEMTFSVMRKQIEVTVATGEMLEGDIGLVTIENFNERCASETIAIIEDLVEQGAQGLVFDVRNNPGGYKDEMVQVLDYLLPEGTLFRSVDYADKEETDTSDAKCLKLPMVVLINGDSYSAAEFFAAALVEYEWAVSVGEPTAGKSHFQILIPLGDGSAVNLSVGKYFTPKGVSLADVGGLQPQISVELDEETYLRLLQADLSPEEDPQIQAAVETLKTHK